MKVYMYPCQCSKDQKKEIFLRQCSSLIPLSYQFLRGFDFTLNLGKSVAEGCGLCCDESFFTAEFKGIKISY